MSYVLDSTVLKRPSAIIEENTSQAAQHRTLDGSYRRDYFGANKRIWVLTYENTNKTDYDTINTIYQSHLSTGATKTWQVSETNYTVSQTNVHVDLKQRDFGVKGSSYISEFDLVLTEA